MGAGHIRLNTAALIMESQRDGFLAQSGIYANIPLSQVVPMPSRLDRIDRALSAKIDSLLLSGRGLKDGTRDRDAKEKQVPRHLEQMNELASRGGFSFSQAERMVFEKIHLVTGVMNQIQPAIYTRATELQKHFIRNAKVEDFMAVSDEPDPPHAWSASPRNFYQLCDMTRRLVFP